MSKLRIKNFGPIKEGYLENDGWMDIKKVTVFIGNQGSGKSTVAKVFSTLSWLEKAVNRGDEMIGNITHHSFYDYFEYQRIKNYFREETIIEYIGDSASIRYSKSMKYPEVVTLKNRTYKVPKIMYVPAERNFLSVVKNAYGLKNLPDTLYTFAEELRKGQNELNGTLLQLPISDSEHKFEYKYNNENDTSYIVGNDFELNLLESSSGFQSLVPLFLVTKFLNDELQKGNNVLREQLTVEQSVRRAKEINDVLNNNTLSNVAKVFRQLEIEAKYLNTCFINIVEEPEQNLFPKSQWQILKKLLEYNNKIDGNKLIITTHSPYLINYLTIAIQGAYLKDKIKGSSNSNLLSERLNQAIPMESVISLNDTVIYQLDENNGTITRLPDPEGIPSDKNYLNQSIAEGNRLFDALLEIEEEL